MADFTIMDVATGIGLTTAQSDERSQKRIGRILRELGYEKFQKRIGVDRIKRWRKSENEG
jgi:hypothetical protein